MTDTAGAVTDTAGAATDTAGAVTDTEDRTYPFTGAGPADDWYGVTGGWDMMPTLTIWMTTARTALQRSMSSQTMIIKVTITGYVRLKV